MPGCRFRTEEPLSHALTGWDQKSFLHLGLLAWQMISKDGDLPVAGLLQSSLDMFGRSGASSGAAAELEDADAKVGGNRWRAWSMSGCLFDRG